METMIVLCMLCVFLLVSFWCLSFFELVANAKKEIALLNGQLVMLKKEWTKELVDGNMN
jgi:hypothetical protein